MNEKLKPELLLAFAPIDKRAFGIAVGVALALGIGLLTVAAVLMEPEGHGRIGLLSQFFAGYSVTWTGALIGTAWGFFVGFIAGWFVAFARNLTVAIWIFAVRTRAELSAAKDFLEHI